MENIIKDGETIPLHEASKALESASRRIALIHLSYARTIIEELGHEMGLKIISRAIKDYGLKIGEKTRCEVLEKGLEAIPVNFNKGETYTLANFPGMHEKRERVQIDGKYRYRAYGCILGKTWQELGEENLGRLYCYMDTAKYMGYNPDYKYVHTKALPDGDTYCEFEVKPTTKKEREDFYSKTKDWFYIDK